MHSSPELSIIFVNWNSLDYLRESLQSIYTATVGIDFEIIVVDNASSRDDATQLKAEFPRVTVVRSEKNLGFARANNLGFQQSSGKYVLFLNPDTKVIGPAIATMLGHLKSLPGAAVVGCKLLNSDGSVQTSCVQRFPTILNQILDVEFLRRRWPRWRIWGIAPLFSDAPEPAEVEVVSGACLMIERDAFERAGMFNQEYFMYAEDVDLCCQVHKLGRKVYYTGEARVVHYGGGTSKQRKGNQWVAVMQRQAILKFCQNTRGRFYAEAYRVAMGINAACRLALLALVLPFRRLAAENQIVHPTLGKWLGVLKWAIGVDRRVSRLHEDA